MAKKTRPAGDEPDDEAAADAANKPREKTGPADGPDDNADLKSESLPVGEPALASAPPVPARGDVATARQGTLYACTLGYVSLMAPDGSMGEQYGCADGCAVEVNGAATDSHDLRRGDRVSLTGDPVTRIVATR